MPNNKRTHKKVKTTQIDTERESIFQDVKINWLPAVVLLSTPLLALVLVPWYGITHGFSAGSWVVFAIFMAWSGLGITAGYHRLWSHKTYEASLPVRFFLLVGATMAVQSSIFDWCSGHREHHKHVDDVYEDPYSAKRGFWFSHIGWMLKNYPSGKHNYRNIPDLQADPMLRMQHKHYHWWVLLSTIGLPVFLGYLLGDIWGTLILAGLLRLVLTHHFTFFINSLAHIWGNQPYTDENTAKDNGILAFFTWGEGYHNYHHIFQYDYRNGIKWWQYDPTKWLIFSLYKLKLAKNLKRVPDIKIQQAKIAMQFRTAQTYIEKSTLSEELEQFKRQITKEYDAFTHTLEEWKCAKQKAVQEKIRQKKAHAQHEKMLLEVKLSNSLAHKKEVLTQVKHKLSDALPEKLSDQLHLIDEKLNQKVSELELRMQQQQKQLEKVINQFTTQKKVLE